MQVLVLVVQNDAPRRDIGVATSTATFLRSMGGSLGVALFGAIFASRLSSELESLPGGIAARFVGGANISPDQVHQLPSALREDFLLVFVHALSPVFLVGSGVAAVAFVLSLMLKEIPLQETLPAAAERASQGAVAGTVGADAVMVAGGADSAPGRETPGRRPSPPSVSVPDG